MTLTAIALKMPVRLHPQNWPDSSLFRPKSDPFAVAEQVMEGKKGEAPKNVKVYNLAERRVIDRELTDKAKDFMTPPNSQPYATGKRKTSLLKSLSLP